jgi:hypothetical protein
MDVVPNLLYVSMLPLPIHNFQRAHIQHFSYDVEIEDL